MKTRISFRPKKKNKWLLKEVPKYAKKFYDTNTSDFIETLLLEKIPKPQPKNKATVL